MLNQAQIERMVSKLNRFSDMIEPHLFCKVGELQNVEYCHVKERYHSVPELPFQKAEPGLMWQGNTTYCWFKGDYVPTAADDGKTLYIRPNIGCYEGLLFVDGVPFGIFSTKIQYTGHGNHYADLLRYHAAAGEKIDVAMEFYAGHPSYGTSPQDRMNERSTSYYYYGADICVKDYAVQDFYFDLKSVLSLRNALPDDSFRKGEINTALLEVFRRLTLAVEDEPWEKVRASMTEASPVLKEILAKKNGDDAGEASIIGHSHMDTAWLWHIGETVKKCARTYSNQLALMQEYPEYKFVQSSSCHSNMILKHYPALFKEIQKAVAEGRYEPNGGVWVECDCNITSGESMIRQFLWGQRFTRKYFNYTSNCFWLPDTFGYSAAIPQIMKGCGVDYFLTTKISWNDTNKFPYDTFYWQGIDGTRVFTHFNTTHHFPTPENIADRMKDVKQKSVNNKRLLAFGYGDGGGGPQFEECEYARRVQDLAGCPKTEYSTVADFMKKLEATSKNPNTYRGELYLELHRGTLTNQHTIKRNNRKAEFALRDLEIATVSDAAAKGEIASEEAIAPLYENLLINQFHDILPGTSINAVHEKSRAYTSKVIADARAQTAALLSGDAADRITVSNTLSFDREDVLFLDVPAGKIVQGNYAQQRYSDLDGNEKLMVAGVKVPAFSSVTLKLVDGELDKVSTFTINGKKLTTGTAEVTFADNGTILSFVDRRNGRELVQGRPLNTFIMAEDMPSAWDNWDVDADFLEKFAPVSNLVSREVISDGAVAYIIRSKYQISEKSSVLQDMIFFAGENAEVRFDTAMDWNDDHRFLKTAFDTSVYDDFVRNDVQFGCLKRPTTRNTSVEEAKFEICNHKYTDLSEPGYGVSILNDCKYGISVKDGSLMLSLHKGGRHPDYKGDKDGIHRCVYSFLPHLSGFSAENVIRPAYLLNVPALCMPGDKALLPLISVKEPNVIVEAIKPCEDAERAYIVRLYEAEGTFTQATIGIPAFVSALSETNMLEEEKTSLQKEDAVQLTFRPFEIKTLKLKY